MTRLQSLPILQQFRPVDLGPRDDETLLPERQRAPDQLNRVNGEDPPPPPLAVAPSRRRSRFGDAGATKRFGVVGRLRRASASRLVKHIVKNKDLTLIRPEQQV